jgi:hypothetical protein
MEQSNVSKILQENEIEEFFKFLDLQWSKNHVFIRDREIFNFQHKTFEGDYNFLIAKGGNNEIQSILGYIFPNNLKDSIWLAIWKSSNNSGDGFRLLKKLISSIQPKFIGAIGISEDAQKLYKILGWTVGSTKHYFLNRSYPGLRKNKLNNITNRYSIIKDIINLENNPNCLPYKDEYYYKKRFLNHPSYTYTFIHLDYLNLLFIGRIVSYLGFKVFRIVDVIGDMDGLKFKDSLLSFMSDEKIDLIEMIMFDSIDPNIDMFLKSENEIIPLYLNPFINKNVEVKLGYKSQNNQVRFFIGDSDQDRPN